MTIKSKYPKHVYYPLFQCAKNCYGKYKMSPFTHNFTKLVILLRKKAKELYGDKLSNVKECLTLQFVIIILVRHQIAAPGMTKGG